MLSLPLRCSRAPVSSPLLRLFTYASRSSPILTALRSHNVLYKALPQRTFHATPLTRFSTSQILRWPEGVKLAKEEEKAIPSFRETIAPALQNEETFVAKVGRPSASRQVIFFLSTSTLIFIAMFTITIGDTLEWVEAFQNAKGPMAVFSNADIQTAAKADLLRTLQRWVNNIGDLARYLPAGTDITMMGLNVLQTYYDVSWGRRLMWELCLVNVGIWVLWKMPFYRLRGVMERVFRHDPLSGRSYTMLTSMFSHRSFLHLLLSCLVLESFGTSTYLYLKFNQEERLPHLLESTASYHFLAFFTIAGMFSALTAHIVATKFQYTRAVRNVALAAMSKPRIETWRQALSRPLPSAKSKNKGEAKFSPIHGTNGALYACVVLTALAYPDYKLSLYFPPTYPVDLRTAVGAVVVSDVVGVLLGWSLYNHWVNLGGALFGFLYYMYGTTLWDRLKRVDLEVQEELLVRKIDF